LANIEFYNKQLNLNSVDEICKFLSSSLIETNYTYDFFVNWNKTTKNRDIYKYQVALLKSLKNSNNPVGDLTELLKKYPEVTRVIPALLACREGFIKVLDSVEKSFKYKDFNFSKENYTSNEVLEIVQFTKNTGLLDVLCRMDSATDYLLGIEVGLDTNARKNRSGLFLEKLVEELLKKIAPKNNLKVVSQKSFKYIENTFGIKTPITLKDRKFDYVVISNHKATNIEVNFYGGTGSKPSEIVSSYINRGEVLSSAGWKFVWLTDGIGWKKMQNPLHVGVENIDYVLNSYLLRKGLLENIVLSK
jgi:type II restriction enzyme